MLKWGGWGDREGGGGECQKEEGEGRGAEELSQDWGLRRATDVEGGILGIVHVTC